MTQRSRPVSDVHVGGWTPVPIFSRINALAPADSIFVTSSDTPSGDYFEVRLAQLAWPTAGQMSLRVRLRNNGSSTAAMVLLLQGSAIVAYRVFQPTSVFQEYDLVLSPTEINRITDFTNLRLRVVAGGDGPIPPAKSIDMSAGSATVRWNADIPTAAPYSMALWIRAPYEPSGELFMVWENGQFAGPRWRIEINTDLPGHVRLYLGNSSAPAVFTSLFGGLDDGNWHHLIIAYDGSSPTCYIDGALDPGTTPFWTGNANSHEIDFRYGRLTDIRTYNRILSASDASSLFNLINVSSALVNYWPCNEGAGNVLHDTVSGNDGSLGANWNTDFPS